MGRICSIAGLIGSVLLAASAYSQLAPSPAVTQKSFYQRPKSYSEYYAESLQDYHRPPESAQQYTVDKYFYHRPTVSPYLNLTRPQSSNAINNYYRYVKPELNRRIQQAAAPARFETAPSASAGSNAYYNRFYNESTGKPFGHWGN